MVLSVSTEPPDSVVRRLPGNPRPPEPRLERARGEARVGFADSGGRTRLAELFQSGAAKVRLPRGAADAPPEAVFLNTAGGVTGGDRLAYAAAVGRNASAVVTSQAAERVYRRYLGVGEIATRLSVEAGGQLDWLPQETILFDRSALSRSLTADLAPDASLLALEAIVLGRTAMGETVREVHLRDAWRIRRGGRLVFADGLRLDGDTTAIMAGRATGAGAAAFASIVLVSPDAEARLAAVRSALEDCPGEGGASAWNGMLTARLVAPDGQALRTGVVRLIETLRGRPMPRVWNC